MSIAYQRNTFSIGLILALTSWSLIFFTLLWGYGAFRLHSSSWLQGYLSPKIQLTAFFNTVFMILSSLALRKGIKDIKALPWLWASVGLGLAFLLGQMQLWQLMMLNGLDWHKTMSGSFFFLLTGFHAAHILAALPALVVLALKIEAWQNSTKTVGIRYFWDLLLVVWLILFVLIFIVQ